MASHEMQVSDARSRLAEVLDHQARDGQVVYLTRYGRKVGAIVPVEDAKRLEEMDDAHWSRLAREAKDRLATEPAIPWDQALAELEDDDDDSGDDGGRTAR